MYSIENKVSIMDSLFRSRAATEYSRNT